MSDRDWSPDDWYTNDRLSMSLDKYTPEHCYAACRHGPILCNYAYIEFPNESTPEGAYMVCRKYGGELGPAKASVPLTARPECAGPTVAYMHCDCDPIIPPDAEDYV